MIKLIIFDFDGVINTGSNTGYFLCYHKALEAVGVSLPPEEERKRVLAYWGKGYKKQLAWLLQEHPELLEEAINAYEHHYHNTNLFFSKVGLIDGVTKTLARLSQKYTLVIATGMMRKSLDRFLKQFNLTYFAHTLSIDDLPESNLVKPHPYMIDELRRRVQVSKAETICVGDSESDIVMAKNAGVKPVAVLTGNLSREEAEQLRVDIIEDVTKLDEVLKTFNV